MPAYQWLWSDVDDYSGHFRRYNFEMLKSIAGYANLKVEYLTYFFFYLPLATFFFRTLPFRIRGSRMDSELLNKAAQEHKSSELSSKLITTINKMEIRRIRTGGIPFGASCLAVFDKP